MKNCSGALYTAQVLQAPQLGKRGLCQPCPIETAFVCQPVFQTLRSLMSETNQVMCCLDRAWTEGSLSGTAGYCLYRKDTFYFSSVLNRMTSILEHSGWKPFWYLFLFWRQIVLMYSPLFYISLCVNFCKCVHTAFSQILEQFPCKTLFCIWYPCTLCTYNKNVVGKFYPKLSYCKPYIILFLIKGYWKQISRILSIADFLSNSALIYWRHS